MNSLADFLKFIRFSHTVFALPFALGAMFVAADGLSPLGIFFGIPAAKDDTGKVACNADGIVQEAVRKIKRLSPKTLVVTDLCFCEYTSHGHCGPLKETPRGPEVDNDATLELLAAQAVSHARAGADVIAPSGMMDGMIGAIRRGLEAIIRSRSERAAARPWRSRR